MKSLKLMAMMNPYATYRRPWHWLRPQLNLISCWYTIKEVIMRIIGGVSIQCLILACRNVPLTKLELVTKSAPADGSSNGVLFQKPVMWNCVLLWMNWCMNLKSGQRDFFIRNTVRIQRLVFPDGKIIRSSPWEITCTYFVWDHQSINLEWCFVDLLCFGVLTIRFSLYQF